MVCVGERVSSDPVVESNEEVSEIVEGEEDREGMAAAGGGVDGAGLAFVFVRLEVNAEENLCTDVVCGEELLAQGAGAAPDLSSMLVVGEEGIFRVLRVVSKM